MHCISHNKVTNMVRKKPMNHEQKTEDCSWMVKQGNKVLSWAFSPPCEARWFRNGLDLVWRIRVGLNDLNVQGTAISVPRYACHLAEVYQQIRAHHQLCHNMQMNSTTKRRTNYLKRTLHFTLLHNSDKQISNNNHNLDPTNFLRNETIQNLFN